MKLNWGTGIGLFYAAFVVIMVSMVFFSARNNIDLVQEDYYAQDLNYETFRRAREHARKEAFQIALNVDRPSEKISLQFPVDQFPISGTITFFRPSDSKKDQRLEIKLDETGLMQIDSSPFASGLWKLQINWTSNDIPVYTEKVINL